MARHKEFDPEQLLDQALTVFWQKGYYGTSMDDLVEATGVQRYGIYSSFNNKHDLLLAALERYQHLARTTTLLPLTQQDAGVEAIRQAFQLTAQYTLAEDPNLGCLMCNTATELAAEDEAVAEQAENYHKMVTGLLHQALVNARLKGEIADEVDVGALANFLFGALIGIHNLVRISRSAEVVDDYIQVVLSKLD